MKKNAGLLVALVTYSEQVAPSYVAVIKFQSKVTKQWTNRLVCGSQFPSSMLADSFCLH